LLASLALLGDCEVLSALLDYKVIVVAALVLLDGFDWLFIFNNVFGVSAFFAHGNS
jgi:hypothetical protein